MQFRDYLSFWMSPIIYPLLCILTVPCFPVSNPKTNIPTKGDQLVPVCLGLFWFITENFVPWEPPSPGQTGMVGYPIASF